MALPKANRLKSDQDFQAVFRDGIRRHGSYLTLRALRPLALKESQKALSNDLHLEPIKVGISISKKVSKKAVVRNRIKRLLTATLHKLLPKLAPGWKLVIVVKPTVADKCASEQFLQELEQLLVQTEVFNGHS